MESKVRINAMKYLRNSLKWLEPEHQRRILGVFVLQILLSLLDLLGLVLIGLIGSLSVSSLQAIQPNQRIIEALEFFGLQSESIQKQVIILGLLSGVLLVGRSMASLYITKRIIFFFSERSADLSITLTRRLFSKPLLTIQERSSQDILYSLTKGTEFLMIQVLGTCTVLVADVAVLVLLMLGLLVFDLITALSTFIIFASITFMLHRLLAAKAGELGLQNAKFTINGNRAINEFLLAFREAHVANRFSFYIDVIAKSRKGLSQVSGYVNFMPYISKYILEATVILGALMIFGIQVILWDAGRAVAALGVFLAAGTRIGPSVLRLQQGLVYIRNSLGMASPTLELMEELESSGKFENEIQALRTDHGEFQPTINISNLHYTYPMSSTPIISNLSFHVPQGSFLAIVGASGVGKSTLVDLILGILVPSSGNVTISGLSPKDAITKWPGAIGYVPQEVTMSDGTILENILMGYPIDTLDAQSIHRILTEVELEKFVCGLEKNIETPVGERGSKLSGGQRQRLGIARSLVSKPKLLILDEATSALDSETEAAISASLINLRKSMTIVAIAHRLRTVKSADFIVLLKESGEYEVGTFEELRRRSQSFNQLMQIES